MSYTELPNMDVPIRTRIQEGGKVVRDGQHKERGLQGHYEHLRGERNFSKKTYPIHTHSPDGTVLTEKKYLYPIKAYSFSIR